MRVLLSTCGSRGDVGPMVGVAVRLQALGAEVRACAPPVFAELPARVGAPAGRPAPAARPMVHGAAEGCDALAAGGVMPTGAWR